MTDEKQEFTKVRWTYAGRRWNGKEIRHLYIDEDYDRELRFSKALSERAKAGKGITGGIYEGEWDPNEKVAHGLWTRVGMTASIRDEKVQEWAALDAAAWDVANAKKTEAKLKRLDRVADLLEPISRAYWSAETQAERRAILARVIAEVTRYPKLKGGSKR